MIRLPDVTGKPVVTWTLLGLNVLIWLAMEAAGGSEDLDVLLDFGAMFGPFIAEGAYWRLFTAMFLHVGFMHLLFNGFALLIFGRLVERIYGPFRFTIIYIVAGLSGSVASYLLNSISIGAGASGAIFGVLGALAAFFAARRDMLGEMGRQNLSGIAAIVAINLLFGFVVPGIDNWAHIGGLAGGFALGMIYAPRYEPVPLSFSSLPRMVDTGSVARKWWVVPAAIAVLSAGTWLGTETLPDNAISHVHTAERLLERQSYDEAFEETRVALSLDPLFAEAYYVRGKILLDLGDDRRARSELGRALQLGLNGEDQRHAIAFLLAMNGGR